MPRFSINRSTSESVKLATASASKCRNASRKAVRFLRIVIQESPDWNASRLMRSSRAVSPRTGSPHSRSWYSRLIALDAAHAQRTRPSPATAVSGARGIGSALPTPDFRFAWAIRLPLPSTFPLQSCCRARCCHCLTLEQCALAVDAPSVTCEPATLPDDTMAWHHDGHGVGGARSRYRTNTARHPEPAGDLCVASRAAHRNQAQLAPDRQLEVASAQIQLHVQL